MTRALPYVFVLVTATLLLPPVHAQGAASIVEIRLLDAQNDDLRIVPVDDFVSIEIVVNNTGAATIEGPLTLNLTIESTDGTYTKYAVINRPGPVGPGNQTTFGYSWSPAGRMTGEHRIVARMTSPASSEGLVATFTVAESGVETGNVFERTLTYYWVFGLFLIAIVVFFVVLAARRI